MSGSLQNASLRGDKDGQFVGRNAALRNDLRLHRLIKLAFVKIGDFGTSCATVVASKVVPFENVNAYCRPASVNVDEKYGIVVLDVATDCCERKAA